MDAKKIAIDIRCLGTEMLCVGVKPYYAYTADGQRGGVQGQAYDVCLPAHAYDHLTVKIAGDPQLEVPEGGCVAVVLIDLVVRPYVGRDGRMAYTATASAIKAVPHKG